MLIFFILGAGVVSILAPSAKGDSGRQIDLFCQYGGFGKDVPCPNPIVVGTLVTLYAHVTYNNISVQSVLVSFEVDNPQGVKFFVNVEETNASGYASTSFTISVHSYPTFPSEWNATATASPAQATIIDFMPFEVYPVLPVGGVSFPVSGTVANATVCTIFVEVTAAPVLVFFARFRRKQNRHVHVS